MEPLDIELVVDDAAESVTSTTIDSAAAESNQQRAASAKQWLIEQKGDLGFRALQRRERIHVVQAYAARNKVVYGQAFDLVRIPPAAEINFGDPVSVEQAVRRGDVVLIEVKAAKKARGGAHFREHFFSLSTAELLVAQSLGENLYKFVFVNVAEGESFEVSLREIYRRAKAIYPTWSIRLDSGEFPDGTRL